jgi:hypothetical protein
MIPLDPVDILCFSAYAVVAQADLITHLVEKLGLGGGVSGFGRRVFRTGRCLSRRSWGVSLCVSWCVHGQQFVMNLSIVLTSSQYTHQCVSVYTLTRLELPPGNTPREKVDCTEIGVHYTLGVSASRGSSCAGPPSSVLRAKHGSPWRLPAVACPPEPGPPGPGVQRGSAFGRRAGGVAFRVGPVRGRVGLPHEREVIAGSPSNFSFHRTPVQRLWLFGNASSRRR